MARALIFAIITAAMAVSLDSAQGRETRPTAIDDPESYAVYASLMAKEWTVSVARAKRVVISRETATHNQCIPTGGAMETDWRPVVESFKRANAAGRFVLPDRDLLHPYVVVPRAEIMQLFTTPGSDLSSGWTRFYDRYPDSGGYMEVSAVGFDSSKTRALVYVAHHCGGLCGGGTHHLLQKVDGRWQPALLKDVTQCMWVS